MKNKYLILLFSGMLALSCSSDDSSDSNNNNNNISTTDFLPIATNGNYWVYDVESSVLTGRDSLYISGEETIAGNIYKKFTTLNIPSGFYSTSLYNNGVRKSGDQLLLTGTADMSFIAGFPLAVPINDFVIFKENAANGQVIGTLSGTLEQPMEGYSLQINYTLSSTAKESLSSYTVRQETYSNVRKVESVLNMNINALIPIPGFGNVSYPILPSQNVVVSQQFYAENIGVAHVITDINYQLGDLSQFPINLPIPASGSEHQEEFLDRYSVD